MKNRKDSNNMKEKLEEASNIKDDVREDQY